MTDSNETVVATFRPSEKRYDLQSLVGGWILIRRQSYGQKLTRLQLSSTLKTSIDPGGRAADQAIPAEIVSALKEITYADLAGCVMDHNLSDSKGRALNFANHWDVDSLDPTVGEEIAGLVEKHNMEIPKDEQENL